MWNALYQPTIIRKIPYQVASERSTKRTTSCTCSSRNHHHAMYRTLWSPRNRRTPSAHRSHLATGFARRWRKISEVSDHGRMDGVAPVVDGRLVLVRDEEPAAAAEVPREGRLDPPRMEIPPVREGVRFRRCGRRARVGTEADGLIVRPARVRAQAGRQARQDVPLEVGRDAELPQLDGRPVRDIGARVRVPETSVAGRRRSRLH